MVTAVESGMVGNLLRRLHLHPMDAAFNDLESRRNTTLSHLRNLLPSWSKSTTNVSSYNGIPAHDNLVFTTPCSGTGRNISNHSQAVKRLGNSSSCPSSEITSSKPFRRATRTKLRHRARYPQCVSSAPCPATIFVKLKRLSPSPDSTRHLTIGDSTPTSPSFSVLVGSNKRSCAASSCYTSPPVLYPPTVVPESMYIDHSAPPTLSNSRHLSSTGQSQVHSSLPSVNPISPPLLSTCCHRTPTVSLDKITTVESSLETSFVSRIHQSETRNQDSSSMYHLRDRCVNGRRGTLGSLPSRTPTAPSTSSTVVNPILDTIAGSQTSSTSQQPPVHLKRRRSFEQLGEFSIHGTPELSNRLRVRRPTEIPVISSAHELQPVVGTVVTATPKSPTVVPSLSLSSTYESDYYWPDFEALSSVPVDLYQGEVGADGESSTVERHLEGNEAGSVPTATSNGPIRDQPVIEVPSWRYTPLTEMADNIAKSLAGNRSKLALSKPNPSVDLLLPVKPQTVCQSSVGVLRTLRGGVLRSPGVLEALPSTVSLPEGGQRSDLGSTDVDSEAGEEEDTSDAVYAARHNRLEWEEIKRERRSRQRSLEEELRQRWEQRDRATWQKRQSGRLDPLTRYNPDDRMPTQLNHSFSQIRRFRVDDRRLPAVAFGCRVPLSGLRPFKRRQ